jgi:cation/acetate symporter
MEDFGQRQAEGQEKGEPELHPVGYLTELPGGVQETGPLSFLGFFRTLQDSRVVLWRNEKLVHGTAVRRRCITSR